MLDGSPVPVLGAQRKKSEKHSRMDVIVFTGAKKSLVISTFQHAGRCGKVNPGLSFFKHPLSSSMSLIKTTQPLVFQLGCLSLPCHLASDLIKEDGL